jgi:XTP/dITP diphosphohydrolase
VIELLLATRNADKTQEVRCILGSQFKVNDLAAHPEIPDVPETGTTFEQNAILKAIAVSKRIPGFVVADDSGLEVDALRGAPGVLSARYAAENSSDQQNIDKLLDNVAQIGARRANRCARFRCVIALAQKGELLGTFEGTVDGTIAEQPRGLHGFGYDPIFVPHGFERTFAELSADVKNTISHRAKATRALAANIVAFNLSD